MTKIELYTVAAHRSNGGLRVFGDDPNEPILDALMATSAIPPLLPPWRYRDEELIDGGVISNPPVSVALARGATEIWTIYVKAGSPELIPADNLFGVSLRVIAQTLSKGSQGELDLLRGFGRYLITVEGYDYLKPWDYDHTTEMIATGYQQAREQLDLLNEDSIPFWQGLFQRLVPIQIR